MQFHRSSVAIFVLFLIAATAAAIDVVRVGTSGDYPPFSLAVASENLDEPGLSFEGFDPDIAHAFAESHGLFLAFEQFRWPNMARDFERGRFDVAMSGVTITPERSVLGQFSVPVSETGAVVLVGDVARHPNVEALNNNGIRIGVNAGGYLQRVAEATFRKATLVSIPDNAAVLGAFVEGNLDAVVTDTAEAAGWMEMAPDATLLAPPLTRDRKAYWIRAENDELAASLDRWLIEQEASGWLAEQRRLHFGTNAGPPTAAPLVALMAGIDERLALMPLVAVAKRRAGIPLVNARREAKVLEAALKSVHAEAAAAGVAAPSDALVLDLFRAQIEAAKQVQLAAMADPTYDRPASVPDVDDALRPALIRIGAKLARLVVALPGSLSRDDVRAAANDQLRTRWLTPRSRNAIADSIAALTAKKANQ